jgi:hypothetical protein
LLCNKKNSINMNSEYPINTLKVCIMIYIAVLAVGAYTQCLTCDRNGRGVDVISSTDTETTAGESIPEEAGISSTKPINIGLNPGIAGIGD